MLMMIMIMALRRCGQLYRLDFFIYSSISIAVRASHKVLVGFNPIFGGLPSDNYMPSHVFSNRFGVIFRKERLMMMAFRRWGQFYLAMSNASLRKRTKERNHARGQVNLLT